MERGQQEWAVSILVGANPKDLTAGIRKPAQMSVGEDLAWEEGEGGSVYGNMEAMEPLRLHVWQVQFDVWRTR